ncbi:hypothetical protein SDC9_153797 [bioreactor metagenome]|uniref:Methyltransferase type 11 domain-containing protein n=1 Tax=bioreactor metagenome TaxID=1076179 RepID=A0A645EWZ0_9ZZZZ
MQYHTHRANPPFWRHDAYSLRKLSGAIAKCIRQAKQLGNLQAGSVIVDMGCGDAPYKRMLTESGAKYIGCDISPGLHTDVLLADGGVVPLDAGSVGCVTSFQVLEHIWDIDAYLGECRRLLSDDGLLILSTHGSWLYHPHPTDFRRWTLDGLQRELSSRGFSVISTWSIVGPLAWTTQFRTLGYHNLLGYLGWPGKLFSALFCLFMYLRMSLEDHITPESIRRNNASTYLVLARVAS